MVRNLLRVGVILLGMVGFMGCPEPPPASCKTNQDCSATSQACEAGRCVSYKSCTSDDNCTWPESQCYNKFCIPTSACTSNQDCSNPNKNCIQGRCVFPPASEKTAALLLTFQNDASGINDVVSGKSVGTLTGSAKVVEEGYQGRAARLEGADASIEIGSTGLQHAKLTVQMWVRADAKKAGNLLSFCGQGCRDGYQLSLDANNRLVFQVGDGSAVAKCTSTTSVLAGMWTHVAGSFDGSKVRCFVNGQQQTESAWTGSIQYTLDEAKIGAAPSGGAVQGSIDNVAVFAWARDHAFSPGLMKFMYLSGPSGSIQVIDSSRDQVMDGLEFNAPEQSVPVGLSPNGKHLYMWSQASSSLIVVDTATKTQVFTLALPGGGLRNGGWVTHHAASNTIWCWGEQISVFRAPLTADSKPVATLPGAASESFKGVALASQDNKFLLSKPKAKEVLQYSINLLVQQPSVLLNDPKVQGIQPGVLSVNPTTKVLYIADDKASKLYLFSPKGNTYSFLGEFEVVDTDPATPSNPKRVISSMLAHSSGQYLFYSFTEPAFAYRLDIKDKIQHVIRSDDSGLRISKFSTKAPMHLHNNALKVYVRDTTSGKVHILDAASRKILSSLAVGIATGGNNLPVVGVLHSTQAH